MLDGGMAQASFSTRSGSHLLPAADGFETRLPGAGNQAIMGIFA
jgi:hypothetical protein